MNESEMFTKLFPVVAPSTLQFMPLTMPLNVTVIVELKPPVKLPVETITVPAPPCGIVIDETFTANVKSEGAAMVRVKGAVAVIPPPVPVTIIEYVPGLAVEATVNVATVLPSPGADSTDRDKDPVTPPGSPVKLRFTAALKVPECALVTLTCPLAPNLRVIEL